MWRYCQKCPEFKFIARKQKGSFVKLKCFLKKYQKDYVR